ncbi:MAG: hypothetical protein KJ051_08455 [Thermoleophilia bacterium]|nr:hypothetical protein [Thermoleophilia bacterium]
MASRQVAGLVDELREFTGRRWLGEPPDVQRLRAFSLPPMGNLPCVLYCNFDLFWAGEQLQVCRQAALAGDLRLPELAEVSALLLERTAARTAKWEMTETVALLRRAASVLREWRPDTAQEFAVVIEHLMMAIDRIQAAVDAIIPWSELDRSVRLRPGT